MNIYVKFTALLLANLVGWLGGSAKTKRTAGFHKQYPNQQQPQHKKNCVMVEGIRLECVRVLFCVCYGALFTVRTQLNGKTTALEYEAGAKFSIGCVWVGV